MGSARTDRPRFTAVRFQETRGTPRPTCPGVFFARGTGSAQAADYLLRETDGLGEVRDDVAVLRGDPDHVAGGLQ